MDEAEAADKWYRFALLFALGPLNLTFDDLWRITVGEFSDLSAAYRYNEHLEARKRAQLACCILSGLVKRPPSIQDIAGVWDDKTMRVYDKMEMYQLIKRRIQKNKDR